MKRLSVRRTIDFVRQKTDRLTPDVENTFKELERELVNFEKTTRALDPGVDRGKAVFSLSRVHVRATFLAARYLERDIRRKQKFWTRIYLASIDWTRIDLCDEEKSHRRSGFELVDKLVASFQIWQKSFVLAWAQLHATKRIEDLPECNQFEDLCLEYHVLFTRLVDFQLYHLITEEESLARCDSLVRDTFRTYEQYLSLKTIRWKPGFVERERDAARVRFEGKIFGFKFQYPPFREPEYGF